MFDVYRWWNQIEMLVRSITISLSVDCCIKEETLKYTNIHMGAGLYLRIAHCGVCHRHVVQPPCVDNKKYGLKSSLRAYTCANMAHWSISEWLEKMFYFVSVEPIVHLCFVVNGNRWRGRHSSLDILVTLMCP